MGRTKALVEVDGIPMADRVLDALSSVGCDPLIVYGGDPLELARLGAPVVADRHRGEGPVGGVEGALRWMGDVDDPGGPVDAVLVLACDLPDVDGDALRVLLDAARGTDVVVAHTGRREPMCALWPLSRADDVAAAFEDGVRSMHELLDHVAAVEVAVPARALRNVNRPEDVASGE